MRLAPLEGEGMFSWWAMTLYMVVGFAAAIGTVWWCAAHDRNPLLPVSITCCAMIVPWFVGDVFNEPRHDRLTSLPTLLLWFFVPLVVASLIFGVLYTRRTGSPLYWWSAVSGWLIYPMVVEPLGDHFVSIYYPDNQPMLGTFFGRGIPWMAALGYASMVPVVAVVGYELAKRLSAKSLFILIAVVTLAEVPLEMVAHVIGWGIYTDNHALVLGVPVYCIVQNGGFIGVVVWAMSHVVPGARGWRWALVPFVQAMALLGMAVVGTFPAYLAIAFHAGPVLGWSAGLLSTAMNAAIVYKCVTSKSVARLRESTETGVKSTTMDSGRHVDRDLPIGGGGAELGGRAK
jgi:hypothetical protein